MLNIKEEQGLPDLHGYHPAFGCRKKTPKTFKACGLFFSPRLNVLKIQRFEYLATRCCYPATCNMQKNTARGKRSVIIS